MKRVLIVDDQRDIRQLLRDSIQLLGGHIDIIDVPSGEEALLVITRQRFDLLVSDVLLAGMSGLELVRKVRKRNPDLKVILVTGMTDIEIRQQVSQAGAEAFFFKPVDIASFQLAVAKCLELTETGGETIQEQTIVPDSQELDIVSRLERLRDELGADCVFWIETSGKVLKRLGKSLSGLDEKGLIRAAMGLKNAGATLYSLLGNEGPYDYYAFQGKVYQLHIVSATEERCLLALTRSPEEDPRNETARKLMAETAASLRADSADAQLVDVRTDEDQLSGLEAEPRLVETDLSKLDMALQGAKEKIADSRELDEYWETAAEQIGAGDLMETGSITYEQALRLGIAPKDESESDANQQLR